jgi:dipeptidyl aminopeptidase/acylaminoacyl peptidase
LAPNYVATGAQESLSSSVWVFDTATGRSQSLGRDDQETAAPVWSPDSQFLAFTQGTDDAKRLWVWSARVKRSRLVSGELVPQHLIDGRGTLFWRPSGHELILPVVPRGLSIDALKRRAGISFGSLEHRLPLESRVPGARVAVYRSAARDIAAAREERTPLAEESGFNDAFLSDLVRVDIETGAHRVLASMYRPVHLRLSPTGSTLALSNLLATQGGIGGRYLYDVVTIDVETGASSVVASSVAQSGLQMPVSWSPDGHTLAFVTVASGAALACKLVEVPSGRTQTLMLPPSAERLSRSDAPLWNADGTAIYSVARSADSYATRLWMGQLSDSSARWIHVPEDEAIWSIVAESNSDTPLMLRREQLLLRTSNLSTRQHSVYTLDVSTAKSRRLYGGDVFMDSMAAPGRGLSASLASKRITYIEQRVDAPAQVWMSDDRFGNRRQISRFNAAVAAYALGRSRLLSWRGPEGQMLHGALLLPANYVAGKRYPLVTVVYGGDHNSLLLNAFGFGHDPFFENRQLLATRGYAVLEADTDVRPGMQMTDVAASLLPGVNAAIDAGIADPDRLGLMGHSYGGYSALAVLVQSRRFKAAVVSAAPQNLIESYSLMGADGFEQSIGWVEEGQGRLGGSLWEHRERFIENSPLFYFDRITTPILLRYGIDDPKVSIHEGDEAFLSLRRLGKTVEYLKYPGEGHSNQSTANALDYAARMLEWFGAYLAP